MINLRVSHIIRHTAETVTLQFEVLGGEVFTYEAGQFLTFLFERNGKTIRRSYSLSSSPYWNEPPSITVKHTENGEISTYLTQNVKPGDLLQALPPAGLFQCKPDSQLSRTIYFFAAGSGIAPIWGMIKSLLLKEPLSKLVLVYSNKDEAHTLFYHELKQLQEQYSMQLAIWWLFSNAKQLRMARLNSDLIQMVYSSEQPLQSKLAFVCGPYDYMENTIITLLTLGFKPDEIRKEQFVIEPSAQIQSFEYTNSQSQQVQIISEGRTVYRFVVPEHTTILEAAIQQQIPLPYSCMAGKCAACSAFCVSGESKMSYNEVLTESDLKQGRLLTCTAYPQTDMVLSY